MFVYLLGDNGAPVPSQVEVVNLDQLDVSFCLKEAYLYQCVVESTRRIERIQRV